MFAMHCLDTYLRSVLGHEVRRTYTVFDERGRVSEYSLAASRTDWQGEAHPLRSILCQYDLYGADGLSAMAIATFVASFEGGPTVRLAEPSLTLEVNGPDPAKVRGVADEAKDRAERGVETPVPVVEPGPAVALATEPEREPITPPSAPVPPPAPAPAPTPVPSPARWSRFINNQWVVGLGVTVIGSLIVALIIAKAS